MKRFPFRLLFVSMFLPPICYLVTTQVLQGYLQKVETSKLNHMLIRDYEALYGGQYSIDEEISRNAALYLNQGLKHALGIRTQILVTTKGGHILYPKTFNKDLNDSPEQPLFSQHSLRSLNYVAVAARNYKILNDGLILGVTVQIKHNTWLANAILVSYIFAFVFIVRRYAQKGMRETERLEKEQAALVKELSEQLSRTESGLEEVKAKEADYRAKIAAFSKEKKALSKDIDGLLDEIESLENGLKDQRQLKQKMELEVLALREELDRLKEKLEKPKQKDRKTKAVGKRFKVLYKNLAFTDKAVEGFYSLTEPFQVKAEEVIHRLNEDESQVSIRRKVFGKGGKTDILEVDFSYSGRIYYRKDAERRAKIVAIGTKKTQKKDLAFLERTA